MKSALDHDSCAIVSDPVQDKDILAMSVEVIQDGFSTDTAAASQLVSVPSLPVIAVVDRSANLNEAARALVRARFSFSGQSPYSPDIVLVNEFTKKDLLRAIVEATISAGDVADEDRGRTEKPRLRDKALDTILQNLRSSFGNSMRVITEATCGVVVDVQDRSPNLISKKIPGPVLVMHSIRSLDDAIDFLARF
jgi:acyl-CoA reductase-like NAD-dependent aldehyde dehydrogenase